MDIKDFIAKINSEEKSAREDTICLGCLKDKAVGDLVCWKCFKYRLDIIPLKFFRGSFKEWLSYVEMEAPTQIETNKYKNWMKGV